jgi:hypothetical protein
MGRKFNIDGREYESYQLSNGQLVKLIKSDDISDDDRKYLMSKLLSEFEYNLCPRIDETDDDVFARFFSNYVNNCGHDGRKAAAKMATDHRTLQNNMFKVCMEYIKVLAENAEKGWYDPRNEYAVKTSKKIIDFFKETNYPY